MGEATVLDAGRGRATQPPLAPFATLRTSTRAKDGQVLSEEASSSECHLHRWPRPFVV